MATVADSSFRRQINERRDRLQRAKAWGGVTADFERLMSEVDAALKRLDNGTFGICQACGGGIEVSRLIADPLTRVCLEETGGLVLRELGPDDLNHLEADLELAGSIQRALLPPVNFSAYGWEMNYSYEPLGPVSGDYCDLILANPPAGELFFLLGDVSGKGVAASLLMSHLHAIFRSLVTVGQPLIQMLEVANRLFCNNNFAGQYATLVAGRADGSGRMEVSIAGHPPALLLRSNGVTRIESGGFPLGMFSDAHFTTQNLELRAEDALLFYSDGVTESRSASGEEYGIERLARFAEKRRGSTAADLVASCLQELSAFSASRPRSDDVTMMALRRAA